MYYDCGNHDRHAFVGLDGIADIVSQANHLARAIIRLVHPLAGLGIAAASLLLPRKGSLLSKVFVATRRMTQHCGQRR